MNKLPLEIVVPIYNEGKKIITLLDLFEKNIRVRFRVLLCYDHETDNIFQFTQYFKNFNFETILVKNHNHGPCSAIKQGLYFENQIV